MHGIFDLTRFLVSLYLSSGISSVGRALASQAEGRESESRIPLSKSKGSPSGCLLTLQVRDSDPRPVPRGERRGSGEGVTWIARGPKAPYPRRSLGFRVSYSALKSPALPLDFFSVKSTSACELPLQQNGSGTLNSHSVDAQDSAILLIQLPGLVRLQLIRRFRSKSLQPYRSQRLH